jgi:spermidine synthase
MAILWQKRQGGHLYQVRQAGKSLRLYTDGVFHTQYRPDRVSGGGYWDLLAFAPLLYPPGTIRRVLVLGVGGGAVIHSLRALVQPAHIDAVELNPVHIAIAKRWFGLGGRQHGLSFHVMDAREFVASYRGPKFDLIVEDVFGQHDGEPCRAIAMDKKWMRALRRCLALDGMLVSDYTDRREFRASLPLASWQGIYTMTLPTYENIVGIYVRRKELVMDIEAVLRKLAATDKRVSAKGLRFLLRKVK